MDRRVAIGKESRVSWRRYRKNKCHSNPDSSVRQLFKGEIFKDLRESKFKQRIQSSGPVAPSGDKNGGSSIDWD